MDLRSLMYFVEAAKSLNFTKTATKCHISQSAISLNIAKMEQELGYNLFERGGHTVKLTPAGADFYIWADITLKSYDNAVKRGLDINGGYSGIIRLAFSNSVEALVYISELQAFRKMNPGVTIDTFIISPHHIVEELAAGSIDAALCVPYDFYDDCKYTVTDLFESPFGLVMSVNHPLAKLKEVELSALNMETALVLEDGGMPESANVMYKQYKKLGIRPHELKRKCHIEEILLTLEISNNIAVIPAFYWNRKGSLMRESLTFRPIATDDPPTMKWALVTLKGNQNPKLDRLLCSFHKSDVVSRP